MLHDGGNGAVVAWHALEFIFKIFAQCTTPDDLDSKLADELSLKLDAEQDTKLDT